MPITIPAQPFTFASESGNQPAAQLDSSFANIRDALTGIALKASDLIGGYMIRGLSGVNNSGTPLTKYDLTSADLIVLRSPSDGSILVSTAAGVITIDSGLTGPANLGRDQSGAFSANTWLHMYYIRSGSTLGGVISTVAPPTGPTLPSGFTHWAYAGAIRFNGSSQFPGTFFRGCEAFYSVPPSALTNGAATTETAISLTALIPPNALRVRGHLTYLNATNATGNTKIRILTGVDYITIVQSVAVANSGVASAFLLAQNLSQNLFYINSAAGDQTNVLIQGYSMPNGGE